MSLESLKNRKCIIPAIATMLNDDESFDEKAQRKLVNLLISQGADGFYVGGSTGEAPLLSTEIRKQLLKAVVEEVNGRVPVIAYVGYIDTQRTIEMSQYAKEIGADGISSVPPYYYGFSYDEIIAFYENIARSTEIPLIVYYIPNIGGLKLDYFEKLLSINGIEGVKWTSPNHFELQQVKKIAGEKLVFSGMDEQFVSGLMMGGNGVIGSTYNIGMDVYRKVLDAYLSGDLEQTRQRAYDANLLLCELLKNGSYLPSLKACLSMSGIGSKTMRRPFKTLSEMECEELKERILRLKSNELLSNSAFISNLK